MSKDWIGEELRTVASHMEELAKQASVIARIAELCVHALQSGGKVMFCGNGGSAADSQHLAAEFVGRYKMERRALHAVALTVDTSVLTAVGNDYGYDEVFRRQVEGIGRAGDVLIGLSTSGNSTNVLRAFEQAGEMGISTVALTGAGGGLMQKVADVCLAVPSSVTNHIQEMHITAGHLVCELVEKSVCAGA